MEMGPFEVRREPARLIFTLAPADELTLAAAGADPTFADRLLRLHDDARPAEVLIDLENIPAISSRQLNSMLALHRALRPRHPKLHIANVSPTVRRLLEVSRTAQFFEFT